MRRRAALLAGGAAAAVLVAGCVEAPQRPDVVARVAGEPIVYAAYERYLEQSDAAGGDGGLDPAVASRLFDRFLEEELLARLAAEELGDAAGEPRQAVAMLVASRARPVGAAEIRARFRERAGEFARPERVDLRQILVADRALAARAVERLRRGEPFELVASSLEPGAEGVEGWQQREVGRDELPPAFADVVFALPAGGVSDVVEAEFGFLVFQVERRLPAEQLSLAAAAPAIREQLAAERREEAREALVAEARDRYDPRVFERNLPFAYRGRFRDPAEP